MKRIFGCLLFASAVTLSIPGCGGSGGGNVADGVEKSAIEEYEANLAAQQAELDGASEGDALGGSE